MADPEPRLAASTRPRRGSPAAVPAPAAVPEPPPDQASEDVGRRIRALENRLAAQAWDIKGLTAQRDEAV